MSNKSDPPRPAVTTTHNYRDHANEPCPPSALVEGALARGSVAVPFPVKLHQMLGKVEATGQHNIVGWQPHGRCFDIRRPKEFVPILQQFFKLSKISSFQRQLNLYGFQRLSQGVDKKSYYHELFLRGRVHLCHHIPRVKVKGTGVRCRPNPSDEPNLWSYGAVKPINTVIDQENKTLIVVISSSGITQIPQVQPIRIEASDVSSTDSINSTESFYQPTSSEKDIVRPSTIRSSPSPIPDRQSSDCSQNLQPQLHYVSLDPLPIEFDYSLEELDRFVADLIESKDDSLASLLDTAVEESEEADLDI